MKTKLLSFILFFALCGCVEAQTQLWGTCTKGGTTNQGTIWVANGDGTGLHKVYDFVNATGAFPQGGLTLASNGYLYGVTFLGGYEDSCVCYKYNPVTGVYTDFHDLYQYQSLGFNAVSGMINGADGNLYGLCREGGTGIGAGLSPWGGVLYKIDPATDIYSDIYNFDHSIGFGGCNPMSGLLQLSDGKFYGTTSDMWMAGGVGTGSLFSYDQSTNTYTTLYGFGVPGYAPMYGTLIQATNGKLYGLVDSGGVHNNGVIYSFDLTTNTYTDVYDLTTLGGTRPSGGVIQASNGLLYGMTRFGGANNKGVIFSYNITTNTYTDLLDFNGTNGASPQRSLKQGNTGKLFGTTNKGGIYGYGVAFSYDIPTSTYTKLVDFDSLTLGAYPDCELTETPTNLGISEITNPSSTKIFPNPATSFINIISDKEQTITITDVLGQTIYQSKIINNQSSINISSWDKGVYFVKTKEGVQKIIKE